MFRRTPLFALALLLVAAACTPAQAGQRHPFVGFVHATWDNVFLGLENPPATFTGGGPVTPLGRTKQTGTLTLGQPDSKGWAPGWGSVTITAENGDKVTFDYVGELDTLTGFGFGEFTFTGGTGRYAHATGGGLFAAQIDLSEPEDQAMTVELDGEIRY